MSAPADPRDNLSLPPESWAPAVQAKDALKRPLERFLHIQASSGIVLFACAVIALVWANSPWKESYHHLWHAPVGLRLGPWSFQQSLHFVINDILMVIFFFVVGLEIRREMQHGELSELKRASLPVASALGGMVAPAVIYLALNLRGGAVQGWGVPMATDIAFAVGVLALLGSRVPAALRVLLLALAIIDDIGAILVIALFYSTGFSLAGLGVALGGVAGIVVLQRVGIRNPWLYVLPGFLVWLGLLLAGVHPTLAGVIIGMLTPARPWFGTEGFTKEATEALAEFHAVARRPGHDEHDLLSSLDRLRRARREALAPVVRLEARLNPWVAFGIMPLFALANAGVTLDSVELGAPGATLEAIGIVVGLAVGKPVGVLVASYVAVKLGWSVLPRGVDFRGLAVVGLVAGVGFTMALFIAQLGFHEPTLLGAAKLAVLAGSAIAGVLASVAGRWLLRGPAPGAAVSADEAERSTAL